MKEIAEYYIITDTEKGTVENKINERLQNGWELYGTLQTTSLEGTGLVKYSQAVVKKR